MGYRKYDKGIYSFDSQKYDKDSLGEIKQKEGIIYDPKGVTPVRIIKRYNTEPLIEIGVEDDGSLFFNDGNYIRLSSCFIDSLIFSLLEAKKICEEIENM